MPQPLERSPVSVLPSIGVAEFLTPPNSAVGSYKFGSPVTRENIVAVFISSFGISQGIISAQAEYFRFLEGFVGHNFKYTIDNYAASGGFSALSPAEQLMVVKAYKAVPGHGSSRKEAGTAIIGEGFDSNLSTVRSKMIKSTSRYSCTPEEFMRGLRRLIEAQNVQKMRDMIDRE